MASLASHTSTLKAFFNNKNTCYKCCKQKGNEHFGIYHFSNAPMITWFEFAQTIKTLSALSCTVNPITTADFPTPAKRPFYSVMDTTKITQDFKVEMINTKMFIAFL